MFFSYFKNRQLYISILALFLLLILFLRIYLNLHLNIPLHFDEAQYWSWSKDLEWGYFSKPPVLAWIISISSTIFVVIQNFVLELQCQYCIFYHQSLFFFYKDSYPK